MHSCSLNSRILIVRLSAIGDCIATMPLAMAIKQRLPDCHLTWIVDCAADQLLRGHQAVDEVIRLRKGFLKRPKELWNLRSKLRNQRFDVALDPQGLIKSSLLVWFSNAKQRAGFRPPQSREKAWWFYTHPVRLDVDHIVDKHMKLLDAISFPMPTSPRPLTPVDFGISIRPQELVTTQQALASLGMDTSPFVAINAGAGWASRRWPVERYSQLSRQIDKKLGLKSMVFWAGDDEFKMARDLVDQSDGGCVLAPPTTLVQLAAFLSRARMLISSDTGPMHLAAAIGTQCISLFGPTKPENCGPYGQHHICIQKRYQGGNSRQRRGQDDSAMREIQCSDVFEAVELALSNEG